MAPGQDMTLLGIHPRRCRRAEHQAEAVESGCLWTHEAGLAATTAATRGQSPADLDQTSH